MSVLVEAVTLVIPKRILDAGFIGGTEAFLETLLHLAEPPRFICNGDAHLANASFYSSEHMRPALALLAAHGIDHSGREDSAEIAFVDQRFGPTAPCAWLEWRHHEDGFTVAWLAGTDPGDIAAPTDWTPERSRGMVRTDIRDDPGRFLRLADEDGIETWLDFSTGEISRGLAQRDSTPGVAPSSPPDDSPAPVEFGPLMPVVTSAVEERGWDLDQVDGELIRIRLEEPHASVDVMLLVSESRREVVCLCGLPFRVPKARRPAVAEAICRVNWGWPIGNFELDFASGELHFRASADVDGCVLTTRMVHNLLAVGLFAHARYHDALVRVAFGGEDPEVVIGEVEGACGE